MDKVVDIHKIIFLVTVFISVGLIVGGFFCPPMGVIDGSVLTAVGELFGFAALAQIPTIASIAGKTKITKGDTSIEIEPSDEVIENIRRYAKPCKKIK